MASQSLPTVLFTLACLSFCLSTAIFVLALMSFGLLSLWIDAASASFTIIYHTAIIIVSYKSKNKCPSAHPPITPGHIAWAFFIFAMWIIAFGITTEVTVNGPGGVMVSERHAPWNVGIQIAQSILTALEAASVGAIAIYCCTMKKKADLENQACQDEKTYYVSHARTPTASSPVAVSELSDVKLPISPPRSIRLQPAPAATGRMKAVTITTTSPRDRAFR